MRAKFAMKKIANIQKSGIEPKMGRTIKLNKQVSQQEIKNLFKSCSSYKVKIRLLAIMNLYNGKTMRDTANFLMISYSNLKAFIKKWNESGVSSLESSKFVKGINKK